MKNLIPLAIPFFSLILTGCADLAASKAATVQLNIKNPLTIDRSGWHPEGALASCSVTLFAGVIDSQTKAFLSTQVPVTATTNGDFDQAFTLHAAPVDITTNPSTTAQVMVWGYFPEWCDPGLQQNIFVFGQSAVFDTSSTSSISVEAKTSGMLLDLGSSSDPAYQATLQAWSMTAASFDWPSGLTSWLNRDATVTLSTQEGDINFTFGHFQPMSLLANPSVLPLFPNRSFMLTLRFCTIDETYSTPGGCTSNCVLTGAFVTGEDPANPKTFTLTPGAGCI